LLDRPAGSRLRPVLVLELAEREGEQCGDEAVEIERLPAHWHHAHAMPAGLPVALSAPCRAERGWLGPSID
jgi:hypothetical protein